jgi:hypothetical protein
MFHRYRYDSSLKDFLTGQVKNKQIELQKDLKDVRAVLQTFIEQNNDLTSVEIAPQSVTSGNDFRDVLKTIRSSQEKMNYFHLNNLTFSAEHVQELEEILNNNKDLEAVTFTLTKGTANSSDLKSTEKLFLSLQKLQKLNYLNLTHQNLQGCGKFIASLIQKKDIQSLALRGCQLGKTDIAEIVAVLPHCDLNSLDLSENPIGAEEVKKIIEAFPQKQKAKLRLNKICQQDEIDGTLRSLLEKKATLIHISIEAVSKMSAKLKGK